MSTWKLTKIDITYPSVNFTNKIALTKYYALTGLNFNYGNYQL